MAIFWPWSFPTLSSLPAIFPCAASVPARSHLMGELPALVRWRLPTMSERGVAARLRGPRLGAGPSISAWGCDGFTPYPARALDPASPAAIVAALATSPDLAEAGRSPWPVRPQPPADRRAWQRARRVGECAGLAGLPVCSGEPRRRLSHAAGTPSLTAEPVTLAVDRLVRDVAGAYIRPWRSVQGSARGFAHIGVLRVLEREGVPVDVLAGHQHRRGRRCHAPRQRGSRPMRTP